MQVSRIVVLASSSRMRSASIRGWGQKLGSSIVDQGILSGANFLVSMLLARWLTASEYGSFAVGFAGFLLLSGFHNALILEPMSVLGTAYRDYELPRYLWSLIWIQGALVIGLALVLGGISVLAWSMGPHLGRSFGGLALAMPSILLYWFLRRVCYLVSRPQLAMRGGVIYAISLLTIFLAISGGGRASSFVTFVSMGLASSAAFAVIWRSLNEVFGSRPSFWKLSDVLGLLVKHWAYGRWVLGSTWVHWLSSSGYLPLVGSFAGLAQAGALQALQNLLAPLQQTLTALGLVLLPWLAGQSINYGGRFVKDRTIPLALGLVSLAVLYALPLIAWGERLTEVLYQPGEYSRYAWLFPYLSAASVLGAATQGLALGLRAIGRPDAVFWSQAVATLVMVSVGIQLVRMLGLYGVVIGLVASSTAMVLTLLIYVSRGWFPSDEPATS